VRHKSVNTPVRHMSVNTPVRHESVNTPVRHMSVNTPSSHERHVVRTWLAVYSQLQLYPQPLYTASQVRTTFRSWDEGVLTDICLTGVLTDLCLTLYLSPLLPHLSIFCIIILFFLFVPLQLLQFVSAFFSLAFLQHDHTITARGIL